MPGSDAALINAIRSGDPGAYDVLRSRHAAAARRLAIHLPHGPATVNDVVDWAFVQVLEAIRRGGGPTDAFRPYLLTAVQRAARDCAAGENSPIPTDDQDIPDPGQLMTAGSAGDSGPARPGGPAGPGRPGKPGRPGRPGRPAEGGQAEGGGATGAAAVAAFMSLPERWRAVLWHTEIEDAAPAAVASLFGLGAADTADLVARARDGMAQSAGIEPGGVHAVLRHAVAPAVLGAGAAGYLTELAYNPPAGPAEPSPHIGRPDHGPAGADLAEPSLAGPAGALVLGAPVAGAELAGPTATAAGSRASAVPGGHRAAGGVGLLGLTFGRAADWWRQAPARKRNLVAEVGVALMVAAIVGFALSLGPDSGRATAAPSRFAAAPRTVAPSSSPPPAPSATPSTTPPAVPPPAMISSSEPSQALPPAARLVASLTVAGPAPFSPIASVNFSVTDAGHVPTGNITAAISLPSTMGLEGSAQVGGWSCVMTGFTAICSHVPLPAGASTADFLTVALNSPSACGKLIELTVTTRSASTSASATIHCSGRHSRASIHRR